MSVIEETIDATLDPSGQLWLSHQPRLQPGPVRVTIRAAVLGPRRGLADVIREIAAEQRARGFLGGPGQTSAPKKLIAWTKTRSEIGNWTLRGLARRTPALESGVDLALV